MDKESPPYMPGIALRVLLKRLVEQPWLLFAVYLLLLTFLTFGTHSEELTATLQQFGLKQTRTEYVLQQGWRPCIRTREAPICPPAGQYEAPVESSVPNPAGFGGYVLAGGAVAFWSDRRNRQESESKNLQPKNRFDRSL